MSINKLEEHINSTREALELAGATKSHLNCFRSVTNKIKKHAAKNGIEEYSSELGLTVIKEYYNILAESDNQVMHHQKKHLVCVNNLNDFLTHGKVVLYHKKRVGDYIIPSGFSETYELYIKHRDEMEMSASTIQGDKLYLERFFLFLEKNGISEPQKITVPVVYDFINEINNFFEKGYVSCIVRSVRLYLRFCYQINVLPIDMMTIIPNIKYNKKSKLPSVYTEDEVKRLLNTNERCVGMQSVMMYYSMAEDYLKAINIGERAYILADEKCKVELCSKISQYYAEMKSIEKQTEWLEKQISILEDIEKQSNVMNNKLLKALSVIENLYLENGDYIKASYYRNKYNSIIQNIII